MTIEAMQLNADYITFQCILGWLGSATNSHYYVPPAAWIEIDTPEGKMTAQIGDYIIKGVKGEFYPCKPDIFHATYDLVWKDRPRPDCEDCIQVANGEWACTMNCSRRPPETTTHAYTD